MNQIDRQIIDIRNTALKYEEFKGFANEYANKVDKHYSKEQERVSNDLSEVILENINIPDKLGIKNPTYTAYGEQVQSYLNLKTLFSYGEINTALKQDYDNKLEYINTLKQIDFDTITWPEGTTAEDIENFKAYIQALKENEMDSFEVELNNLLTADKLNFITKGEENLSVVLDLIPIIGQVKGLGEVISGQDLITGRELSTTERCLIAGSLLLDVKGFYSVGKAATSIGIKEGGKQAIKYTGRQFTKEFAGGVTFYGASSMASELGVSPKGQLAIMAGMFAFGNRGQLKAAAETGTARIKGVSKNSALDNLRLTDKTTYDSIMKNLETSTRKNTVSLSSFGAGELQRLYDNNASLRAAVKDFDELSKCISGLSEVNRANAYKILSGSDSKKIAELSDVIKGSAGDSKKISDYLGGVEGTKDVAEAVNRLKNIEDNILDVMESSGGHTLDRHVGKSKEYLIERTKKLKGKGATTYTSKDTATKAVKDILSKNSNDIIEWLNNSTDARLIIKTDHSFNVGNGVLKGTDTLVEGLRKTVTVIERTNDNELGFRIITSYPAFN